MWAWRLIAVMPYKYTYLVSINFFKNDISNGHFLVSMLLV